MYFYNREKKMISYYNKELTLISSFLKLKFHNIFCGTYTGKWTCALPFNRLIYIFEGSSPLSSISSSKSRFDMLPGHWLFIPANMKSSHEQYENIFLISIHFSLELVSKLEYMQGCSKMYMGEAPEKREEFFQLMDPDAALKDVFLLQKLIWEFLSPVAEKEKKLLEEKREKLSLFQILMEEFTHSPCKDFSVEEMAKIMKMGKEAFIKSFTKNVGVPPKLFFHQMRASAASETLLATDKPIKEIANMFHFSDEFYFSRFMKRMTGLSPREYRKKMSGTAG